MKIDLDGNLKMKSFFTILWVIACAASPVAQPKIVVDDFSDGNNLNNLDYPWYYYDDNAFTGPAGGPRFSAVHYRRSLYAHKPPCGRKSGHSYR
jgi:hypothetical protein